MESHKVTKKEAQVYITGYKHAVEVCCGLLKEVVGVGKASLAESNKECLTTNLLASLEKGRMTYLN